MGHELVCLGINNLKLFVWNIWTLWITYTLATILYRAVDGEKNLGLLDQDLTNAASSSLPVFHSNFFVVRYNV